MYLNFYKIFATLVIIKIPIKLKKKAYNKNFFGWKRIAPSKPAANSSGNGEAIIKPAISGKKFFKNFDFLTCLIKL